MRVGVKTVMRQLGEHGLREHEWALLVEQALRGSVDDVDVDAERTTARSARSPQSKGVETCPAGLRSLLVQLYESTGGGKAWQAGQWNTSADCLEWEGVSLEGEDARLQLALGDRRGAPVTTTMMGELPATWLTDIAVLFPMGFFVDLNGNAQLGGELPAGFVMPASTQLYLFDTRVSGSLPADFTLPKSTVLHLSNTRVSGSLPANFAMHESSEMHLVSTKVAGALPADFTMSKSSTLDLSETQVSGALPPGLTMPEFSKLHLSETPVSGAFPANMTLAESSTLELSLTQVSGVLPSEFTMAKSSTMYLDNSKVSGSLPAGFVMAESSTLNLATTAVSGSLPVNFTMPKSSTLYLSGTAVSGAISAHFSMGEEATCFMGDTLISGSLPADFTMPRFAQLGVARTQLSGSLPAALNMAEGCMLQLFQTQVSGSLPAGFTMAASSSMDLSNTRVGGVLPIGFAMAESSSLDLSATRVSGELPATLTMPESSELYLSNTRVEGSLPAHLTMAESSQLYLSATRVEGSLPTDFTMANSSILTLRGTFVSGRLPAGLSMPESSELYMENTRVSGILPAGFSMAGGSVMRLSSSFVSGSLPTAFSMAPFCDLRLDGTQLDGTLPAGFIMAASSTLQLQHTRLSGTLPRGYIGVPSSIVRLSNTSLSGALPAGFSIGQLSRVYLDGTRISGEVHIASLGSGSELSLSHTHVFGRLPFGTIGDSVSLYLDDTGMTGMLPFVYTRLRELSISSTDLDVCAFADNDGSDDASIFASTSLRQLNVQMMRARTTWSRCSALVRSPENPRGKLVNSSQVAVDTERHLQCPVWRIEAAERLDSTLGYVTADSTFLDFHLCVCPAGHYFGRAPGYSVGDHRDWSSYRQQLVSSEDLYDASIVTCQECPEDVLCDPRAGPSNSTYGSERPQHELLQPMYPMYHSDAEGWHFDGARWKLVHAELLRCQHMELCNYSPGRSLPLTVECRPGHDASSLLCSRCVGRYYRDGLTCKQCHDGASWLVPLMFSLAAVAFAVFLTRRRFATPGVSVGLWFFWLQLEGILSSVHQQLQASRNGEGTGGGGFFAPIQRALQAVAMFHPFALQCVRHSLDFGPQTWIMLLSPFFVGCVFLVLFAGYEQVASLVAQRSLVSARQMLADWKSRPRWGTALLFTWTLMLFPVMHRVFQTYGCDSAGPRVDITYLRAAPWIECGSDEHIELVVLATLVLFGFVIPLLGFIGHRLRRYHHTRALREDIELDQQEHESDAYKLMQDSASDLTDVELLSFMTAALRPSVLWWPIGVLQVRAVSLAATVALLPLDSAYLPLSVFLILLASLLMHVRFMPYRRKRDNRLEAVVLAAAVLRYMLSMLNGLANFTSADGVGTLASLLSLGVFVHVMYVFTMQWRASMRRKLGDYSSAAEFGEGDQ